MTGSTLSPHTFHFSLPDRSLLARAGRGDEAAFECLYDRHRVAAHYRALRYCQSRFDAEEIVQEAFVKVWRSAALYDASRGSVRVWILAVVTRRAIDKYRWARRRVIEQSIDGREDEIAGQCDTHLQAEADERQHAVRAALRGLPVDQRRALALTYYAGLSHSEVASTTRDALGTVKGRIRLGHARLRTALSDAAIVTAGDARRMPRPRIDCATATSPGYGGHAS
jgi:RNA polymerase sigma-70 factor, ECF subfamily